MRAIYIRNMAIAFQLKEGETEEDAIDRMLIALENGVPDYVASWGETEIEEFEEDDSDIELPSIPAIDAAPVKHGRWEGDETCKAYDIEGVKTWAVKCKCSVCGFVHIFIEAHMCYAFCPNCGAKMDLDTQREE